MFSWITKFVGMSAMFFSLAIGCTSSSGGSNSNTMGGGAGFWATPTTGSGIERVSADIMLMLRRGSATAERTAARLGMA